MLKEFKGNTRRAAIFSELEVRSTRQVTIMFRKISLLVLVLAFVSGVVNAGTPNPDADVNGCFVDAPVTVNEGVSIPVTVKCVGIPTDNNVFGFQIGTSVSGDFAGAAPTTYTAGEFTSLADGGAAGVLLGDNTLDLYGVSRRTTNVVAVTDFTLGSYSLTADTDLTIADGDVAVTLSDSIFKLSDNYGLDLNGWLRTVNDSSTTINDIDLAWLSGNTTIKSDSNAIGNIKNVTLDLGAKQYTAASVASYQTALNMDSSYLYVEDANGFVGGSFAVAQDSDNTLEVYVNADMFGHLGCSTASINLLDAGAPEDVDGFVGTSGAITLKAGDANDDNTISNTDATIIGDDFGDTGVAINALAEGDVNVDDTINIFDLVHVGRNFTATIGACA